VERVLSGMMVAVQPANRRVIRSGFNPRPDSSVKSEYLPNNSKLPKAFIPQPDNIRINTMIAALVRTWKSLKAKVVAVIREAISPKELHLPDPNTIVAGSQGNVMNTGKRYRKTSGYSPFFSLFTFFGLRQ